jgi:hypothetical protein
VTKKAPPNDGATESQDAKKLFRSPLRRARFNKSVTKFVDESFAAKSPDVKAADDEFKRRQENAWKSEFQQALALAAAHLPSTKPRTSDDRDAVKKLIEKLRKLLRGRPLGRAPSKMAMVQTAELAAANLVRAAKHLWREESGGQRASLEETEKMIADAIERASIHMSVPKEMIRRDKVRKSLDHRSSKIK